MNFVFFGESIIEICFMFLYPPDQIIRHSYIECSVASTGKYVSIVSKHRGTLVVLDSCIRRNDRNAVGYRVTLFAFFFPISTSTPSVVRVTRYLASSITTPSTRTDLPARALRTSPEVAQNQINLSKVPILIVLKFSLPSVDSSPPKHISSSNSSLNKMSLARLVSTLSPISLALLIHHSYLSPFLDLYPTSHTLSITTLKAS